DDAAAASRAQGGVPDDRLGGDVAGAVAYLRAMPAANGNAGTIGYCSGGRQSFLDTCCLPLDAAVDCYGAYVVGTPPEGMPLKAGPIVHLAKDLSCPLLGLTEATVYFDHPHHARAEHTLNIDFLNPGQGPSARVALELTAASARALAAAIVSTLASVPPGLV